MTAKFQRLIRRFPVTQTGRVANRFFDRNPNNDPDSSCIDAVEALATYPRKNKAWVAKTSLEKSVEWLFLDFEFGVKPVSVLEISTNVYDWKALRVVDPDGFVKLPKRFAQDKKIDIEFNTKVTKIEYDYEPDNVVSKHVKVSVDRGDCDHYLANFVVLTVPIGSLLEDQIDFVPALDYEPEYNPFRMTQYIRIYFRFDNELTKTTTDDGTQVFKKKFLMSVNDDDFDEDGCIFWQNLDVNGGTFKDKHIWECTLTTEAFDRLTQEFGGIQDITLAKANKLLIPLRKALDGVPSEADLQVTDFYSPDLFNRAAKGFGAFAAWIPGAQVDNFYEFFGGGPFPVCEEATTGGGTARYNHNGCDSKGVWRLHLSGACSCLENSEWVHGAFWSGRRSGRYVQAEINQARPADNLFKCDDWFFDSEDEAIYPRETCSNFPPPK